MTEPEKKTSPPEIPAERMMAFLAVKKVSMKCPMCGANEWTAMENADNRGFLLTSQSPQGSPGDKVLPVISLICQNCHYVWMVARNPVEIWLREHPDGDGK